MVSQGEIGSWKQQFSAHAQPVYKHNMTHTQPQGWCYQTTPLGSNAQSKYSNYWDMNRTISNFKSQRTPRLSWSRLTDRQLAQCRTLSLIASEARFPQRLWVFSILKYCCQTCEDVVQFAICIRPSIQYSIYVLWQDSGSDSDRYSQKVKIFFWNPPLIREATLRSKLIFRSLPLQ